MGNHPNQVRFSLNALDLSRLSIQSQWTRQDLSNANANPQLRQWAQRAWLLVLQDFFHFPLPLLPGSSLRLDGAQVRSDDLLLRFRFEDRKSTRLNSSHVRISYAV